MYFEDLSPYAYDVPPLRKTVLNVGWLDPSHSFSTGNPPDGFLENLKVWSIEADVRQMRGYHLCCFCLTRRERITPHNMRQAFANQMWLGSCEMWIPGEKGQIYACPNLIVHYVEEHLYLPPGEFIEAVMKPIPSDWDAEAVADAIILDAYTARDN